MVAARRIAAAISSVPILQYRGTHKLLRIASDDRVSSVIGTKQDRGPM